MMQFSTDVVKWVSKIPRNGLMDVVLNCTPEGLRVQQYDDMRYQYLDIFLSRKDESVLEYEVKDNIVLPIQNIDMLTRILKSFDKEFELIPDKTQAIFKSKSKEVKYQLIDQKMIANVNSEPPKIKFVNVSTVPLSLLKEVLSDIVNISGTSAMFSHRKDRLLITIEGCNHRIIENYTTENKYEVEVNVPTVILADVISKLTEENVDLSFPDNNDSMQISERNNTMKMKNLISAIDDEKSETNKGE